MTPICSLSGGTKKQIMQSIKLGYLKLLAFPTRPSQAPMYKEYGAGPVACFNAADTGSWATFVFEHRPNLDLGGYELADGFYDLNTEPLNNFDFGTLV